MATFRKRGDTWRAEVSKLGVRRSGSFDTKSEAVAWATQVEADILSGRLQAVKQSKTLTTAMTRYRDEVSPLKGGARWERIRLNKFISELSFVGDKVDKIQSDQISAWRDSRLKEVSPGTVNREMNLLSAVFEECRREWKWCSSNPVQGVRRPPEPPPREQRISDNMADALIRSMGYTRWALPQNKIQRVAMAFLFAMETGMRAGEIVGLTADRVFLPRRYLRLEETKNGDARNVPLSSTAIRILEILLGLPREREEDPVFGVTGSLLDAMFRKYRDKAAVNYPELAGIRFHDTRHEAVSRLARKLDVLDLARMIGHRDIRSLMIYYNEHASEIATRLE
ncbi:Probable integrase/recombinase protein [Laribacter hongkongensis HLHK9]|uniref:Probable integrase/recombinase protein n=2 Tax=Laribacter hongkongensis TaxID=168471 RepID=C1D8J3_LARHH|nr:site-specific integrase [Laribacter hongkongensis]ACO74783.1 Probable integrase/recombinase protein [Laribacter hongkongensis HLHK9]